MRAHVRVRGREPPLQVGGDGAQVGVGLVDRRTRREPPHGVEAGVVASIAHEVLRREQTDGHVHVVRAHVPEARGQDANDRIGPSVKGDGEGA